jgi:hypothetical protein
MEVQYSYYTLYSNCIVYSYGKHKCIKVLSCRLLAFAWALAVSVGSAPLTVVANWNFTHLTGPSSYATSTVKRTVAQD